MLRFLQKKFFSHNQSDQTPHKISNTVHLWPETFHFDKFYTETTFRSWEYKNKIEKA